MQPYERRIVDELQHQSTWRLFFLGLITFGIYWAFYVRRQSRVLNQYLEPAHRLSGEFSRLLFLTSVYVVIYIPLVFALPENELALVDLAANILDVIFALGALVWSFMACGRLNYLLGVAKGHKYYSNKWWSWLFTVLYFNFRINKVARLADRKSL